MPGLHDAMVFTAVLPNTILQEYSLAEYLAWRETCGVPVPESKIADLITWMQMEDNNFGRLGCYLSVQEFRKAYPGHPAVTAFTELAWQKSATLRGQ